MPRDSSSSDSDDAPARRAHRRKSSDEDAAARRDNGDRRARLEARRRAAESSDDEEAPARKGRLDDEALTSARAPTRGNELMKRRATLTKACPRGKWPAGACWRGGRPGRLAMTPMPTENAGEQPVDPVNPRGDGRARALERRDRMKQADDALVPTSPKDEETGLTAREKARSAF